MMYDLFHFDSNEKVKHATVRYFMKSDAHHLASGKRDTRERESVENISTVDRNLSATPRILHRHCESLA